MPVEVITVASLKMLPDTVVLYNYIGEVNDEATYQETVLTRCYCPLNEGADLNLQGKKANNSARLYIFDAKTVARSSEGTARTFLPYHQWKDAADKSAYWTLSDKGTDYILKQGGNTKLRVIGFAHKKNGSRRMWHYEVDAQ